MHIYRPSNVTSMNILYVNRKAAKHQIKVFKIARSFNCEETVLCVDIDDFIGIFGWNPCAKTW